MLETDVITFNVQGLKPHPLQTKIPFITGLASTSDSKIIALTESHLSPNIENSEIHIMGYTPFRSDRELRTGGGVITYIRSNIACRERLTYSDRFCSINIVELTEEKMIVINLYRPPACPSTSFQDIINRIKATILPLQKPMEDIIMLGDFNFPRMKWPEGEILPGSSIDEQLQEQLLLDFSSNLLLSQCITKPTRGCNTLDLLFTNNHELILHYSITPTIYSDHDIVEVSLNQATPLSSQPNSQSQPLLSKLDFFNADWELLNHLFQETNWDELFLNSGPIQKYKLFQEKIEEICNLVVPHKRIKANTTRKIPRQCKIWFRNKANISKQIKCTTSRHRILKLLHELHSVELKLKKYYENDRRAQEEKALESIKTNPKTFFRYAKKFSKTRVGIGPLLDDDQMVIHSPGHMADLLRSQYDKVFAAPRKNKEVHDPKSFFSNMDQTKPTLTDIDFTPQDIGKAIDLLKNDSAPGPDGLPTLLLKKCKTSLSLPLFLLWRQSLNSGKIPGFLKNATIIPIHKGESRAIPKNYRPVSLTSHVIKLFERVVRNQLVTFLEENYLMNDNQHGFRPGRSCLTQLIEHYDLILEHLENGGNVDVIYLDFAKAFDKVDHGILCHKLLTMGIGGKLGEWLHEFLHGRMQKVLVNGASSPAATVKSGVPQGTVLGPILFLVHIADINNDIVSHVSSFADDTRVLRPILNENDVESLQSDLRTIYAWQELNNMEFNDKKFEALRYGKNQQIKSDTLYTTPSNTPIEVKHSVKDLGIVMSDDGSFKPHILALCNKIRKLTGWILRTFITRDRETMKVLWSSLIQPHIDYCSQLWAPHKFGELSLVENLQRTFTSNIEGLKGLNYWERLSALGWFSVERRIERYRVIYTWKALEQMVPDFGASAYETHRHGRLCQIPSVNTKAPLFARTLTEGSLRVRGPRLFNSIPAEVRALTGCSIESFKRSLDKFLRTVPDRPRLPGYAGCSSEPTNSIQQMVGAQR